MDSREPAQKLELGYLLVDWQIGARYRLLGSVSAFAEASLERGLFGSYDWICNDGSTIAAGDAGEDGSGGRIDLPRRTVARLGATWRVFGRLDISPWISMGAIPLVMDDSHLVHRSTGRRIEPACDEEGNLFRGKFGLRLGYAL